MVNLIFIFVTIEAFS